MFASSKLFAIDLSLKSLSYAIRTDAELEVKNARYMQADILDLRYLNKRFDIIDCGGVLHHMENPFAALQTLVDYLRPGGLVKIGLYSKLSLKNIESFRSKTIYSNAKKNGKKCSRFNGKS